MTLRTVVYPTITPKAPEVVRILGWNVYYGNRPSHAQEVLEALRKFDCDILALSELIDPELPQKIHKLGYGGVFVETNYMHNLRRIGGGIGLFSRFRVESHRVVNTREQGMKARRCYVEASLHITKSYHLTVGTTHHTLPVEPGCSHADKTLWREIGGLKEHSLLIGDLNKLPGSTFIRQLKESLVHLGPDMNQPSYPASRLVRWLTPQRRLDYAFGTQDVSDCVVDARFLDCGPSDHRPLLVHLRLTS